MSEAGEIKRIGAKAQRNSGRGILEKGDAIFGDFLVDIKEYAKSFSVSRTNWAKLQLDAYKTKQREPAFCLVLGEEGEQKLRLWVVREEMFLQMKEAWEEKNGIESR